MLPLLETRSLEQQVDFTEAGEEEAARLLKLLETPARAGVEATASSSSQLISNMIERYVILNSEGGWLENTILWDGVTPFELPPGTELKKESEIDHASLPPRPEEQP